jgi:hypothetical protein
MRADRERPNVPGAPKRSWSLALPEPLENLQSHPLALAIAQRLRQRSVAPASRRKSRTVLTSCNGVAVQWIEPDMSREIVAVVAIRKNN